MIDMKTDYSYGNNLAFGYKSIVVSVILERPIALLDQWSPTLESILVRKLMLENALLQYKPDLQQAQRSVNYIRQYMPLKTGWLNNKNEKDWYWQCSSPCVKLTMEDKQAYRGYWDTRDFYPERITKKITWFVVAHTDGLCDLLNGISYIGKVRTNTYSPVLEWKVTEVDYDWHLWRSSGSKSNKKYFLNKPVPIKFFSQNNAIRDNQLIIHWGWKSPGTFEFNQDRCYMPTKNIISALAA
ncbi:hypothetical protein CrV_gp058 [Cylindrospermopsis raciborskii virus RM-2018a]|nr:hypothetical protein CrV_gp058 [Cylindrospermopsis raciborskii virus RM-2018a]